MNQTPHFKLKFKIEVLEKLSSNIPQVSNNNNHRTHFEEFQLGKMGDHSNHKQSANTSLSNSNYGSGKINSSKNKHSKYGVRNSKFFTGDIDSLPGYDVLTANISREEKDELLRYIKGTDNTNNLFQSFHLVFTKKYYSKIKCKNGMNIITNIFKDLVKKYKADNSSNKNLLENKNQIDENLSGEFHKNSNEEIINEIELFIILKDVIEMTDIDACEIFNMFKFNESFSFTEKHFTYLFYLFSSYECNSLNDFITLFGDEMFELLSANEKMIDVSRMRILGELLNIPIKEMNNSLKELSFNLYTPINQEKFMQYYLNLAKKVSISSNIEIKGNNWNIPNSNNNTYVNVNKGINKTNEGTLIQNTGNNLGKFYGNKPGIGGTLPRKENNTYISGLLFNQKKQISNFNGNIGFKSKDKQINKLNKKIQYKK